MSKLNKEKIINILIIAIKKLKEFEDFKDLMPEVRINLAYSILNPKKSNDVAAIPGRITVVDNKAFIPKSPEFGASDHMARNIIEFAKYNKNIRASINFKYTEEMVDWLKGFCKKNNLSISIVDRNKEPEKVQEVDGASIPWKIEEAVELASNKIPDIIVEGPAIGKEPLILITGENPIKVVNLLKKIHENWINFKKKK